MQKKAKQATFAVRVGQSKRGHCSLDWDDWHKY